MFLLFSCAKKIKIKQKHNKNKTKSASWLLQNHRKSVGFKADLRGQGGRSGPGVPRGNEENRKRKRGKPCAEMNRNTETNMKPNFETKVPKRI